MPNIQSRNKKQRRTNRTVLVVGEGPTEKAFLIHMKKQFLSRDSEISITVECGKGGSAKNILDHAVKLNSKERKHDRALVIVDTFPKWQGDLLEHAERNDIELIGIQPCLECFFLQMLKNKKGNTKRPCEQCKSEFERDYLDKKQKLDSQKYKKHFARDKLLDWRTAHDTLDLILKHMFLGTI